MKLYLPCMCLKEYLAEDLKVIFDDWFDDHLKTAVYPQYKDMITARKNAQKASIKGNAYTDLQEMVGLKNVKTIIDQALRYYKAKKLFAAKGLKQGRPAMHMVFTGNPGTAKTTVARLLTEILKDNDVISTGHLVETGRADLIGKYIGWTAPNIKKRFADATVHQFQPYKYNILRYQRRK